ncbi:endothelin-converting enzyme homolog [Gigantopelta aegis]|uniref:endothelin-converting enzyme homolog n=1 Tax=Gigantopelta aegis TaxID=1735272 RepID=UPI001B889867|nr:endothelin-converting enzyme homolog [Gigantopelta aegis]
MDKLHDRVIELKDLNPRRSYGTTCAEENELLNANSIKMTDAPFGRTDSEDDIVEEYDDVLTIKASCLKNRTALEKFLMVFMVLALAVIIGLTVGLTRPVPPRSSARRQECIKASSSLLDALDPSVNPCDDFYLYACGGWVKNNPIPRGYQKWDRFQELSGKNLYILKNLIESHTPRGTAQQKVKEFYSSCMNESVDRRAETLRDFHKLISQVGGWSYSNDTGDSWSFETALELIHSLGARPFFQVIVDVDERNPTERHMLKIDLGHTSLPSELFPVRHPTTPGTPQPTTGNATGTPVTSTTEPVNPTANVTHIKKVYVDDTVHILRALGVEETEAKTRADLLLTLEEIIASASPNVLHTKHDKMNLYNIISIADLEKNYTMIHWVKYFTQTGYSVKEADYVVILHPHYLSRVSHIVKDYMSQPRLTMILRDYMVLSLVRSLKEYFDPSTFTVQKPDEDEVVEHWKRCAFYANQALGFATGAIYVRELAHEANVEQVEDFIQYVKNAFKDYLLMKIWMDRTTRRKAGEKIDHIVDKISYPSFILNTTFLDTYYNDFKIKASDWFQNILEWKRFDLVRSNTDLKEKPDRKKRWIRPPITVNSFYSPTRNDLIFPIAMFHLPFYIPNGPKSVNFGAMGSVIGHEITHAFDIQGRQYDSVGRLHNWWDPNTAHNFAETTPCVRDQYDKFKFKDYWVNGSFTLDENIADNGGVRAANYAYQTWIEEHTEEPKLPGLNLTHYQIFFVSFAQMYCSKYTDIGLLDHLLKDPHSPGYARVNGALSNSKTFSWAFECSNAARMNPRIKCRVW